MADILAFRTKRLTGFIPASEGDGGPKDKQNRAFWIGPEVDTSPCETPPYRAPEDGDCA